MVAFLTINSHYQFYENLLFENEKAYMNSGMQSYVQFSFITAYVTDWDDTYDFQCPNNCCITGMHFLL